MRKRIQCDALIVKFTSHYFLHIKAIDFSTSVLSVSRPVSLKGLNYINFLKVLG